MSFNTDPNSDQLEQVKTWLIEEDKKFNEGFFCNWKIIENSYKQNRFFTFSHNGQTIGFISWTEYSNSYVGIDIMEIHPELRKKGFGELFYKKTEEYFKFKKFKAIKLFCSPKESERFWQKMEFIKFPNRGYSESELTYYKPLIDINQILIGETNNKLELWNLEPYEINEQKPKWTWEIKENHKPILQPCNGNWNLRLTLNGKVIKEDKVKYFSRNKEIEIGPFLFIETIE